jgi:amino acid adenylation domain-containing protein
MFVPFTTLFNENCSRYSQCLALSYNDHHYTYYELNQYVDQLVCYFKYRCVKPGMLVAVISNAPLERIASILALWKLRAAYLPIDPNYPIARINFILNDSKVNFIITDKSIHDAFFKENLLKFILLEQAAKETMPASYLVENSTSGTQASDVAYVAYTSGSTGNPKAAVITQGNVASIYHAWQQVYELTYTDKHLQIANFGFDVCSGDIIRALGSGAQLVVCPSDLILQPELLYALLEKADITVAEFTPIVLRRLVTYLEYQGLNLQFMRLLICGSDSWYMKEYQRFQSFLNPNARLINSYGTTETTIDSTYFELDKKAADNLDGQLTVPLGRPFPNTLIKILNDEFEECLAGGKGEICIGGTGVSLGYLNQAELTQKKFIRLPRTPTNSENNVFYRTGDLGSYALDGNLHFLGRIDDQIKVMGNRVELIEIEEILNQYSGIDNGVVISHPTLNSEEKLLVAFIITNPIFKINDCIAFLKSRLPNYAVPVVYISVNSFPISHHGKLDRGKLASELTCKTSFKNKAKQSLDNIKKTLEKILLINFNIYTITSDNYFFSFCANTLFFSQLVTQIERNFKIKLQSSDFFNIFTIDKLVKLLKLKLGDRDLKISNK